MVESCSHLTLVLVQPESKCRCRHCQLVLSAEELGESFCPECFEERGLRNYDFEKVAAQAEGRPLYVCEDCGVGIG